VEVNIIFLTIQAKDEPAHMLPLWEAVHRLIGLRAYRYSQYTKER